MPRPTTREPGNAVPIRGSGSKWVSVPFKIGSRPGLRGVAAPLLADLIRIRRLRVWFLLDNELSTCTMVLMYSFYTFLICLCRLVSSLVAHI